jgi:hypothetical protein
LAQSYLGTEIKHSFPEIMKKIETGKISVSLLNYQVELLEKNHKQGRIDEHFFAKMKLIIERNLQKIENDTFVADEMPTPDILYQISVFSHLEIQDFDKLMEDKI